MFVQRTSAKTKLVGSAPSATEDGPSPPPLGSSSDMALNDKASEGGCLLRALLGCGEQGVSEESGYTGEARLVKARLLVKTRSGTQCALSWPMARL